MQWQETIAGLVRDEILTANHGRWPETQDEWERLAHRFGDHVKYCPGAGPDETNFSEGVFHVPPPGVKYPITHPLFVHELAEACLQWEGREPVQVPASADNDRHFVAVLVEQQSPGYAVQRERSLQAVSRRQALRTSPTADQVTIQRLQAQVEDLTRKYDALLQHLGVAL